MKNYFCSFVFLMYCYAAQASGDDLPNRLNRFDSSSSQDNKSNINICSVSSDSNVTESYGSPTSLVHGITSPVTPERHKKMKTDKNLPKNIYVVRTGRSSKSLVYDVLDGLFSNQNIFISRSEQIEDFQLKMARNMEIAFLQRREKRSLENAAIDKKVFEVIAQTSFFPLEKQNNSWEKNLEKIMILTAKLRYSDVDNPSQADNQEVQQVYLEKVYNKLAFKTDVSMYSHLMPLRKKINGLSSVKK